jgi:methylenetetrahydrofolate--tRNA-(uracil-5-)-methyltransferase
MTDSSADAAGAAVTIVGAGLAGAAAALELARRGHAVRLVEQKPRARTPAQSSDQLCELVCSNSLRGAALTNAVGLLKEEMRRLGNAVIQAADAHRVPAGGALAVDRERFSRAVTERLHAEPRIAIDCATVTELPPARPVIVATGPLTGDALAADLERVAGAGSLAYYDAIAPIVSADSIDRSRVFAASRWDKGDTDEERSAYLNCPLDEAEYRAFVAAVLAAERVAPRSFEEPRYFEGCLPIEVMAERGPLTLAYGPMKPIGLTDPRTGRRPYAVVQLRQEDAAATAYNLVGFQTRMTRPEQARVLRTLPGLEDAEFLRFGAVHRNTFVDAPRLLDATLRLRGAGELYLAGQLAGTEGYVESAALGWLAAHCVAERLAEREPRLPPATTAHGGLLAHLRSAVSPFQPSNITFAHLAPWEGRRLAKRAKYAAMAERALADLARWGAEVGLPEPAAQADAAAAGSSGSAPEPPAA